MTAVTWEAAKAAVEDFHFLSMSRHYGLGGRGKQDSGIEVELFFANAVRSFLFTPDFAYFTMLAEALMERAGGMAFEATNKAQKLWASMKAARAGVEVK